MRLARSNDIWRGLFKQTDRPIDFSSRIGKQVSFLRRPPQNILADRPALVLPRSLVVLLEDEAGALFAKALLESGNSKYVSHCGIFVAGGESEISRLLDIVRPRVPTTVTIGLKVVCTNLCHSQIWYNRKSTSCVGHKESASVASDCYG